MDKPFSLLLLPFIFGIISTYFFKISSILAIFFLILALTYLLYNIINRNFNQSIFLLLFFSLGMVLSIVTDTSYLIKMVDENHEYKGVINKVLLEIEERARYIVEIEEVNARPIDMEKLVLNIIDGHKLEVGDRIIFQGKLKLPTTNTNPRLYNYRLSLKSKGIHTSATIKQNNIKSIESGNKDISIRMKTAIRYNIQALFKRHLNSSNADLMTSIILGDSSYLEEDFLRLYRDMGLAHILAVSGLHIGIISAFIFFLLSRLGLKRKMNVLLTLLVIWIYGYLIDFPPSILRANIMFSIFYYSQIIHEPYDSINTLSFAAFVLLIINPYYIFNIGFQLSFMATLSILLFYPKIRDMFKPEKKKFYNTLSALLSVHIGLLPIQVYYFNTISLLSILANLIIVPILSISIILASLMILVSLSINFLNNLLGPILNLLLNVQFWTLKVLDGIPFNTIKIFSPHIVSIIFYYILLIFIIRLVDLSKLKIRIISTMIVSLIFISLISIFIFNQGDFLELHFIDVGQGDSLLIRSKTKDYLVDTGGSITSSFDIGKNITLPYLEKIGAHKLEAIFISHFHEDHSQGLELIINELKVKRIFSSYIPNEEINEKIKKSNTPLTILGKGDKLSLDKLIEMHILWPDNKPNFIYDENNLSLVCLLNYNNYSILLTGDLENQVEEVLKDTLLPVDVIKVPHHGSATSSTEDFLRALWPDYAIIPVGRNNLYGHPSHEVLNRYEKINSKIYRTDENGLIRLRFDKYGLKIRTYLDDGEKILLSPWEFVQENLFSLLVHSIFFLVYYILLKIYIGGRDYFELL